MYKFLLKPLFFQMQPEKAHHLTMQLFRFALSLPFGKAIFRQLFVLKDKRLERQILGLTFPNPVGLAAGFDKDGKLVIPFGLQSRANVVRRKLLRSSS